jgi:hypothetical protein
MENILTVDCGIENASKKVEVKAKGTRDEEQIAIICPLGVNRGVSDGVARPSGPSQSVAAAPFASSVRARATRFG